MSLPWLIVIAAYLLIKYALALAAGLWLAVVLVRQWMRRWARPGE